MKIKEFEFKVFEEMISKCRGLLWIIVNIEIFIEVCDTIIFCQLKIKEFEFKIFDEMIDKWGYCVWNVDNKL